MVHSLASANIDVSQQLRNLTNFAIAKMQLYSIKVFRRRQSESSCYAIHKAYLAAFAGVDAVVEPGGLVPAHAAQHLVVAIEF